MSDLAEFSPPRVNLSGMAGTQITDFMRIRGSSHHHTGALDIAVVGTSAEALLSASAISQLDIVTVQVPEPCLQFVLSFTMTTSCMQAHCSRKGLCTCLEVQGSIFFICAGQCRCIVVPTQPNLMDRRW